MLAMGRINFLKGGLIPNRLQSTRNAESVKEARNGFVEVVAHFRVGNPGDVGIGNGGAVEDGQSLTVAVR